MTPTLRSMAGQTWRGLRAATGGAALVLTYHRVFSPATDRAGLAVEPALFREQLDVLASGYQVLRASELCSLLARGSRLPRRAVVVTFDDGYHDLHTHALPALREYSIPATAFITTGDLGTSRERWWDEAEYLAGADEAAYDMLMRELGPLSPAEQQSALDAFSAKRGVARPRRPEYRALTAEELAELDASGLVEIGAHTVTHRRLSSASDAEQHTELAGGKRALETLLGHPVTTCSYPFGGREMIGGSTRQIAREAGFECAFANWFGLVFPRTDRFAIPRCATGNLGSGAFAERLDHWFSLGR